MEAILDRISTALREQGVELSRLSVKRHIHQGWMSEVFTVESSAGPLMVQVSAPGTEHMMHRVWEKFSGLRALFDADPTIPTPHIWYAELVDGYMVLVQEFVQGRRAGERILVNHVISDKWDDDTEVLIPKIVHSLEAVHAHTFESFGWPVRKDGALRGSEASWSGFLQAEVPKWLAGIHAEKRVEDFIHATVARVAYNGPASLVHGDAINPSNILIKNDESICIIDWEWAILADPAWEYSYAGWEHFLDERYLARDVVDRATLYRPLWLLWAAQLHATLMSGGKESAVYQTLMSLLFATVKI